MPWLQRYATPLHILITLGLYLQLALLAGVASAPGVYAATLAWPATASWAPPLRVFADSNLIDIGDDTLIGGDAQVVAHSAERGMLVTAPIRIGSRVTIGLLSVIFPGVTIGDDAVIAACAVLPKGTQVGAGEIWGGVPARKIGDVKRPHVGS